MNTDRLKPDFQDEAVLTVSLLTEQIQRLIANNFPAMIWVRGEITNFRPRNHRGHVYLSLKDEKATLPCVFFAQQNARLNFELSDGLEVLVGGRLDVYAPHGRYQLIIERMLPGGVGQLYLRFEKLKKKLEAEGLFAEARKRPLPRFPHGVAVITSKTGAVIRDILKILQARAPHIEIIVCPVPVQGDGAAAEIATMIERVNALTKSGGLAVDTIILARGGGSIEDLWAFNEEAVARAIAASKLPLISAVGHETDFTISDFVADARAATPTHAAELVTASTVELLAALKERVQHCWSMLTREIEHQARHLQRLAVSPSLRSPQKQIDDRRLTVDRLAERGEIAAANLMTKLTLALAKSSARLQALDPRRVLERGYALVESSDGRLLRQALQTNRGEQVHVRLWQGALTCRIEEVES